MDDDTQWSDLDVPGDEIPAVAVDSEWAWLPDDSADDDAENFWQAGAPWIAGGLVALGAPSDLTSDLTLTRGIPSIGLARRLRAFLESMRSSTAGEILYSGLIWYPMPAVASGSTVGVSMTTKLTMSEERAGTWKLTIGGLGLERQRTYEVSMTLSATASDGDGVVLEILVPLIKTVRLVVPNGGSESFPMTFLEHAGGTGPARLGSRSVSREPHQLLSASRMPEPPIPLGGDHHYLDSRSRKTSTKTTTFVTLPGDGLAQTLSATFESAMEVSAELQMSPGQFKLTWLSSPLGAVVTS